MKLNNSLYKICYWKSCYIKTLRIHIRKTKKLYNNLIYYVLIFLFSTIYLSIMKTIAFNYFLIVILRHCRTPRRRRSRRAPTRPSDISLHHTFFRLLQLSFSRLLELSTPVETPLLLLSLSAAWETFEREYRKCDVVKSSKVNTRLRISYEIEDIKLIGHMSMYSFKNVKSSNFSLIVDKIQHFKNINIKKINYLYYDKVFITKIFEI